ncbi:MAG: ATP-binding protein [Gammaproteobacteria bacterium]|nr:ATP-binding protein [Gammaproteobacteria bacterium]
MAVLTVVRVDNTKTAVVHGAGAWGELNASYRAYARAVRFHIDPCAPYSPEHKGKVERAVRTQRFRPVPAERAWDSVEELQVRTDAEVEHLGPPAALPGDRHLGVGGLARRTRTALRLSNLPPGQTLADFDFAFQPAIERSRIETLATCAFIRAAETVLIKDRPASARAIWPSVSASKASSTASPRSSTASTS